MQSFNQVNHSSDNDLPTQHKSVCLMQGINLSRNNYFDRFELINKILFWKYDPLSEIQGA